VDKAEKYHEKDMKRRVELQGKKDGESSTCLHINPSKTKECPPENQWGFERCVFC